MVHACHVQMNSARVRSPVWTVSGMGYWKRMIKISGDTDHYYYIILKYCVNILVPYDYHFNTRHGMTDSRHYNLYCAVFLLL